MTKGLAFPISGTEPSNNHTDGDGARNVPLVLRGLGDEDFADCSSDLKPRSPDELKKNRSGDAFRMEDVKETNGLKLLEEPECFNQPSSTSEGTCERCMNTSKTLKDMSPDTNEISTLATDRESKVKSDDCNFGLESEHPCQNQLERESSQGITSAVDILRDVRTSTSPMTCSDDKLSSVVVDTGFAGKVAQLDQKGENCQPLSVVQHKPMKTGTQRFRWNLLLNVLVWLIVPLPLWMPYVDNGVALYLIPSLQAVFVLMWIVIVGLATRTMVTLYRSRNYDFKADYLAYTDIRHLVAISCYKEPVSLIARSVQSLADQTEAARITMVISFEQKTPDVQTKIQELENIFSNSFEKLLFTIHPFGLHNEIPGKCSNCNHGLREATKILKKDLGDFFDPTKVIVTTCDADSKFHPKYIEALTSRFVNEKTPHNVVFQAPLLYNWGLDGASFATRVTGILRSTLMMGALIPFNINTMSIFSFSLKLCMQGNYVHPAYQMDDIICLIRWMGVTGKRLRVPLIPVPVISGPTSGETIEIELSEWARQARRWTIGAGEVFHYYVIKAGRMPFFPAFSWGLCFLTYYGILLCSGGLFGVSAAISMSVLIEDVPNYISYTMYGLAGLQQLCFLVMFFLDVAGPRLMDIKEHISFIRNALHWILTPLVLIGYSLVEFYALHEVMVRGKKVCKHGSSKKGALQSS